LQFKTHLSCLKDKPGLGERVVEIQMDLNLARFNQMFVDLMKAPTPQAH